MYKEIKSKKQSNRICIFINIFIYYSFAIFKNFLFLKDDKYFSLKNCQNDNG